MNPRPDHPSHAQHPAFGNSRLNLLLSCAEWRQDSAIDQLPALLAPMGICTLKASSGEEAADVIRSYAVHIAVVDVSIPMQRTAAGSAAVPSQEAGSRVLQLLRRLQHPPPTVVVRPPQPARRESVRGLSLALREGAFAVLDQPIPLEAMLETLRRILRRHYANVWPS